MSVQPLIKKRVKVAGIRKIIGEKMRESITQHPQGTLWNKIEMDNLFTLKADIKQKQENITTTGLLIKAVSNALEKNPALNAGLIEDEILIYENINMGVAVEYNDSLFVVVVRDTQDKDAVQISQDLNELMSKLRLNEITIDDFMGATFVISNLGLYDLDGFTPLISPPLTGILGIGTTRKEVVVNEKDEIEIKKRAEFTLTLNHASTDGAPGARFFQDLKNTIEHINDIF